MNHLILGLMRGDEGKGKITDYFAKNESDIVIRYAGSCNAGHTIYRGNKKIVLHQIPSGILHKRICIIGRGCLIDLKKLFNEIDELNDLIHHGYLDEFDREDDVLNYLGISYGAHLIFKHHIEEDIKREDSGKGNGSTKCGIAPGYRDKYYRTGIRIFDLINTLNSGKYIDELGTDRDRIEHLLNTCAIDEEEFLNKLSNKYDDLLFEGAQGVLLDINSPYYPNVSSSSVGLDGVLAGTGINYNKLIKRGFNIIGVVKSYMSSVGVGKFLTQLDGVDDRVAKLIRDAGNEYGATTGRPRKVGWFDLPLLKYSIRTSGANKLCITRLDTLMDAFKDEGTFKVCINYKNIKNDIIYSVADIWHLDSCEPIYQEFKIWNECSMDDENFKAFIDFIQENINIPISYLSIGKNEDDIIEL